MPSASCLVQEGAGPFVPTTGGVNVSQGSAISIKLASTASVATWKLEVFGTDELSTPPSLTNVNPTTHVVTTPSTIVTFTFPAAVGRAIVFRSTVDNGIGGEDIQTFGIYTAYPDTSRVGAAGETKEGEPDFGWTIKVNPIIRGLATLAGDLTGTLPNIVVQAVNGTTVPTTSGGDVGKVLQVTGAGAAAWQTFSTTPSGPAGGDLSGTYPNPTVAKVNGAVAPPIANGFPGQSFTVTNILSLSDMAVEPSGNTSPDTIWILSEENQQGAYTGPADGNTTPTFLQFNVVDTFETLIYSVVNDVLWVSGDLNNVYRIDKTTGNVIATVPVPATITEMVEDPTTGKIWCVSGGVTSAYRIDPGTNTVDHTTVLPAQSGNHITYSSTLGAVWVSLLDGTIASINSVTGAITHTVTVSLTDFAMGSIKKDPFHSKVWVGSQTSGKVYRVDEAGFTVDATFDLSTLTVATQFLGLPAVTIEAMAFADPAGTLVVFVADAADVGNIVPIINTGAGSPTQQAAIYQGANIGHVELAVVNIGSGQTRIYGTFSFKDIIEIYNIDGAGSGLINMVSTLDYEWPSTVGSNDYIDYLDVITPVLGTPIGFVASQAIGPLLSPVVQGLKVTLFTTGVVHSDGSGVLSSSTIVNADVDAAAAIAGSKINPNFGVQTVTGGQGIFTAIRDSGLGTGIVHSDSLGNLASSLIVNADVNAAAAIAGTKISPNFGSQNVTTTGSGTFSSIRDSGLGTGVVHSDGSGNFSSSTIVNADVSGTAAIDGTKINPNFGSQNVSTTGTLSAGATTATSIRDTGLGTGVVHSDVSGNFTSTTVVNADVDAAAAIDGTKINPNFGSQNVQTTGTLSAGATTATSIRDTGLGTGVVHSDASGNFTSSQIVNADVSATAAIDGSKINPNFGSQNVSTTGSLSGASLAISGTSATVNSAKIQRGSTKIHVYGIAGRQQTANTSDEVAAVVFDPSAYYAGDASLTRTIQFVAVLECATSGQTASLELFNITDGGTVVTLSTSNTTPTIVTSATLTVPTNLPNSQKLYGLRLSRTGGTSSNLVTCKMARLEVIFS